MLALCFNCAWPFYFEGAYREPCGISKVRPSMRALNVFGMWLRKDLVLWIAGLD